jgi:hypothetical protein
MKSHKMCGETREGSVKSPDDWFVRGVGLAWQNKANRGEGQADRQTDFISDVTLREAWGENRENRIS